LRPAAVVLTAFALAACGPGEQVEEVRESGTYAGTAAEPDAVPTEKPMVPLTYVDVTAEAGIDFVHETGAYGEKLLPETMGVGGAFLDHDGDGDPDLLLVNGDWWPGHAGDGPRPTMRLYRNDGGWRFTDVTEEAGLAFPFYGMGAAAADIDGDGDTDLFLAGVGGYHLLRNDGGRFTDVTPDSGLNAGTWTDSEGNEHGPFATSPVFVDHDVDGRPDLFVAHYVHWSKETDVFSTMNGRDKSYAIPKQYAGESCRLFRNLGDGRFEDVTDTAGVRNDDGKSLGVSVIDFNDDGLPDIAVANDTQPDYLYRNDGGGKFTEIGIPAGIAVDQVTARARAGMGIDGIWLPDSGKPSLVVGNFSGEPVSFFELLRDEIFVNRADVSGVALATHHPLTFGVKFCDADLDGRPDLLLVNGHIEPTIQSVHADIPYEQPALLLRNVPGKRFVRFRDVSAEVGADFVTPRVGRGLGLADVDGDGDVDVLVTTNGGPPALLRCDLEGATQRSLRVRVVGEAPGTDALGARVQVEHGDRTQVEWVRTGSGYLFQSELTLTFGLGDDPSPARVTVRWPDGRERVFEDVGPGTLEARLD
jgi:hypothetical protein